MQRVQKLIAASGYCSRRNAEMLIKEKRVKVNNKIITVGDKASETDTITINNKQIKQQQKHYYVLNKPVGYVTTCYDPIMKNTIFTLTEVEDLIDQINARLYPVGRLDKNTGGIIILTNDGNFANRIMHPRHEVDKSYMVALHQPITKRDLQKLRMGVTIDGKKTYPAKARRFAPNVVQLTIHEGRNRIVRKMFKKINHKVVDLERISVGSVQLGELRYGHVREMTKKEIESFMK
jgi:23S rRNA pseudouridine2605 synthase